MSKRNTASGPYRTDEVAHILGATITTEIADMLDTKLGTVYRDGTYRVRIERKPALPGQPRTKTFYGETAWCRAESYACAAVWFFRKEYRDGRI